MSALIFIVGGLCVLQVFLSKREGKIPGLIIPFVFFILSLIGVLDMFSNGSEVGDCLLALLLGNIPTFICLAIYFVCREKYQKKNQMDKMNILDLD